MYPWMEIGSEHITITKKHLASYICSIMVNVFIIPPFHSFATVAITTTTQKLLLVLSRARARARNIFNDKKESGLTATAVRHFICFFWHWHNQIDLMFTVVVLPGERCGWCAQVQLKRKNWNNSLEMCMRVMSFNDRIFSLALTFRFVMMLLSFSSFTCEKHTHCILCSDDLHAQFTHTRTHARARLVDRHILKHVVFGRIESQHKTHTDIRIMSD